MPELVHPAQLDPRLANLERPHGTGLTAGLCRALAERWQVDPIIVRLVMLALTFAGGVGIALYAWGWLLTPRVGEMPPILRWLPAFGGWPRNTQAIIVAASSLVLVLTLARQTGVAWGPVIVVGALAWAMARRRRSAADSSDSPPGVPSLAPERPTGARGPDESVEQWRARLSPHTGAPLPAVDLYAPEPAVPPRGPAPQRSSRSTSWWAALVIVLLSLIAGAIPFLMGLTPSLILALFAATGTATVLILGWALGARRRRLPHMLLVVALLAGAGTGFLATAHADLPVPETEVAGADPSYAFVGEVPVDVDLTERDGQPAMVFIDATASVVRVRLREIPQDIDILSETIEVETNYPQSNIEVGDLTLVLDGDFSVVEVTVEP